MKNVYLYACMALLSFSNKLAAQSGSGTASFTAGVLAQNFDGFSAVGCPCNTGMPAGWYVYDPVDSKWAIGTGTASAGNLYLLGSGTDKALGGIRLGTVNPVWGVNISNNTASLITSLRVQFSGESWRVVNRNLGDTLHFQYHIAGGGISDLPTAAGWLDVDALDYRTLPLATGATTATGAANNSLSMDYTITGIVIPINGTIFLRWIDADVLGTDDATAIDDVIITANPSCGSINNTFAGQDFESPIPLTGSCWSTKGMAISTTNAIYNAGSGRTTTAAAIGGTSADQVKADLTQTGLYDILNSNTTSTINWEFTVRSDLNGQAISATNLWGYSLYTNQSNLLSTTSNTGYAVGVNLGGIPSDRIIKLYKLTAQRWDQVGLPILITSAYTYPPTSAPPVDRNVTIKVVRTGSKTAATWQLFINNVSQGTVADATPVLPLNMTTPSFTSGFFNIHTATRAFEIDDIMIYSGPRPCTIMNSICRNALLLPLTITQFKGALEGQMATLDWEISNQINSKAFEIERSIDGKTFEKVGTVTVSDLKNRYQFTQPQSLPSAYYRLKMIDHDGFVAYSQIVYLTGSATHKNKLFISPNPVLDKATIIFSQSETGILKIMNSSGKLVREQKIDNQQQVSLPVHSLTKGHYIITFSSNSGMILLNRFVKL